MKYSPTDIERIVSRRLQWRRKRRYSTPWGDATNQRVNETVGVLGEVAFAEEFDTPIDEEEKPNGDGGVDFVTALGTVDVKTRRNVNRLLIRADKPIADYVFVAECDGTRARLIGWIAREDIVKCRAEKSNVAPKFHMNYVVPRWMLGSVGKWKWMLKEKGEEVAA